jgi:phage terminase small subunit
VWKRIIDDLPAGFYAKHELDQLRAYCEAAAMQARACDEMKRKANGGPVITVVTQNGLVPRKNPWFEIYKESSLVLASLGTKLRISKNAKLANREAGKIETGKGGSKRKELMFGGRNSQ